MVEVQVPTPGGELPAYLAAAPDLFARGRKLACLRSMIREAAAGHGPTFDAIEAVWAWLTERADCTGRIGVIGFCMGGGVLRLAPGHRFQASSVNYATARKAAYAEEVLAGACPIVGSYGGRDRFTRGRRRPAGPRPHRRRRAPRHQGVPGGRGTASSTTTVT